MDKDIFDKDNNNSKIIIPINLDYNKDEDAIISDDFEIKIPINLDSDSDKTDSVKSEGEYTNKDGDGSKDEYTNKDGDGSEDEYTNKDGDGSKDEYTNKDGDGLRGEDISVNIKLVKNQCGDRYNKFIDLNNKMECDYNSMISKIKLFDKDSYTNITFHFKKDKFDKDICNKLTKLSQKIRIMDKKNSSFKNCFDYVNIGIILLSSTLTLLEAFKGEFNDKFSELSKKYLKLSPILISSIITCSASILKFKKFQEKIELLTKIKEKGLVMITKFKKLKENVYYVEDIDNLNRLILYYNKDIYEQYALVQQEISQCISNKDYKYLTPIFETDSKIHILNRKRSFFFNNYDYPKNQINAEFTYKCKKCNTRICCCV